MQVFEQIDKIRSFVSESKCQGSKIGLVPTMGALHAGHGALIKQSIKDCDITICSIFVNPTQFNNQEDLEKYPVTIDKDIELLKSYGCQAVFMPSAATMYPDKSIIHFGFNGLDGSMEGVHRPGHFNGVALVVSKLFNIIQPYNAYFGLKDLQQLRIIQRLVNDLSFQINVKPVPIVREESGLAMSSRNQRLSDEARGIARELNLGLEKIENGVLNNVEFTNLQSSVLAEWRERGIETEYLELVDAETLAPVVNKSEKKSVAICVAAMVDGVRLIDNRIF